MTPERAQAQAGTAPDHASRAAARLWLVAADSPDQPLHVAPLPDAALLAARQITIPFEGGPTRFRVASHHWVLDEDGGWRVVMLVQPPPFSFWGWLDRVFPNSASVVAPLLASTIMMVPAVLFIVLWRDPFHWLGRAVANLDLLTGAAVGIVVLWMSARDQYVIREKVIGLLWFASAVAVCLAMWTIWPEFFAGDRSYEEIGADAWARRGEIAAGIGGWLVAALTFARLFGFDRPGAMGAASWLQKREGTAPAARGGLRGLWDRLRS